MTSSCRNPLRDYDIGSWFYNSIVTTLGIAICQIVVSLLAAFALTYYRTPFNAFLFYMLIATMVVPFQVTMIPNYILTSRMGILNTPLAVIIPNIANASTFFFLRQHVRWLDIYIGPILLQGLRHLFDPMLLRSSRT